MLKRILLLMLLCGAAALPIFLTEQALHLPSGRRRAPEAGRAGEIAAATGATLSEADVIPVRRSSSCTASVTHEGACWASPAFSPREDSAHW
jgi:hypothetical protein